MAQDVRPGDLVDSEIRRFLDNLRERTADHAPIETMPLADLRRMVERARAPWSRGGPDVDGVVERRVPTGAGSVRVRIYNATAGDERPALVYAHGGGWTMFSLETHDRILREYAARADIAAVAVDYSLAPESRFPAQLDEVRAVVHWLAEQGAEVGIDAARLALGGDSSGANLAVTAALALRDQGLGHLVRALVLNYGVFDNDFDNASYSRFDGGEFNLTRREMQWFWDNYIDEAERANPLAAPLRAELAGLPPAYMVIAACDVLLDENLEMADALERAGVDVTAVVYPGTTHSFLEAVSRATVSQRAFADTCVWLSGILRSQESP